MNKSDRHIDQVNTKTHAYQTQIQLGTIIQGLVVILSLLKSVHAWHSFGSWLRTIHKEVLPPEPVKTMALRNSLPKILTVSGKTSSLMKFYIDRIDTTRAEGYRLLAT